jgi:hypothetical protein
VTVWFLRVIAGGLLFLAVAQAFLFGVTGSAEMVIRIIYGPLVDGVEKLTMAIFSKQMWDLVVKPILGWPSWIFPLLAAALVQTMARRKARGVG